MCVKVTGVKPEIDRVIAEMNPFLTKLVHERGTMFHTVMDYPRSILLKFDDPNDATTASIKISALETEYEEQAHRTKFGAEKYWLDESGSEVLRIVVMPEHLGYERGWKI